MTDTIVKGSGNSRSIQSVPNLAQLAPTYDKLLELLTTSGLPIDLGPLNSAGLDVRGTDLNKANVLPNATCTSLGISTSSVPKDAFNRLLALVDTAQSTADDLKTKVESKSEIAHGSYIGSGSMSKTIVFPFQPKLAVISGNYGTGILNYGMTHTIESHRNGNILLSLSWSGKQVTISGPNTAEQAFNSSGATYKYTAFA